MNTMHFAGSAAASVLVFHPEPLIGMMIEEILLDAGFAGVSVVTSLDGVVLAMHDYEFAGAVLCIDSNNGELVPVARHMQQAGLDFVLCGALSQLPRTDGLHTAPNISALANAQEFTAALGAIGVTPTNRA